MGPKRRTPSFVSLLLPLLWPSLLPSAPLSYLLTLHFVVVINKESAGDNEDKEYLDGSYRQQMLGGIGKWVFSRCIREGSTR